MPDTYNGLDALQGIMSHGQGISKVTNYDSIYLGMTKLQQWKADSWLPGVKDWVQTGIRDQHTAACGDRAAVLCW